MNAFRTPSRPAESDAGALRTLAGALGIATPGCLAALAALALLLAAPEAARAQDSEGRGGGDSSTSRPRPRPIRKPKKVIRARPEADVEKVPTASVIIISHPAGADVFVDNKNVGTTGDDGELELAELRLGAHRIRLHKDGYREWSQTVTLKTTDAVEVNPLLQDLHAPIPRDLSKLPTLQLGQPLSGSLTRDDQADPDGSGFYDEAILRATGVDAFIIRLKAHGFSPTVSILDDDNRTFEVRPIGPEVYESLSVPHAGTYFVRVSAEIDESSFDGGDYTLTVQSEGAMHSAQALTIGQTVDGSLKGASDAWTFDGAAGVKVVVTATSSAFLPEVVLSLNNATIAESPKETAKKKKDVPQSGSASVTQTLSDGTYTVTVRSADGTKAGPYHLSISLVSSK